MKYRKHELMKLFNMTKHSIDPILATMEPCCQSGVVKYYLLADFTRAKKKVQDTKRKITEMPQGAMNQAGILDAWKLQLSQFKAYNIPHAGTYICKSFNEIKYWLEADLEKILGPRKKSIGQDIYVAQRETESKILKSAIQLDKLMAQGRRQNL